MKKIVLNKKTLRVLTPAEEALVSGGTDTTGIDVPDDGDVGGGGDDGGGDYGGGGNGGSTPPPKGTFDSECRCPSDLPGCKPTQQTDNPKCNPKPND